MERKALSHSGITMDTNKNHTLYSEDFISSYKDIVSSYTNTKKKCEINPDCLSREDLEKLLSDRISSFENFIKVVFANQKELVFPRKVEISLARVPEYYKEGRVPIKLLIGGVKSVKFNNIEILGGTKNSRGFMLRDPVSESITWKTINYSNSSLDHFLTFDVISYLVSKDILYEKLPKKHHAGRFVFFGGTTNHAHLIWEFLMRMPIISDLFKEEEFKLAVTTDSKNLVERWFDLLGYPKDNLYFFDGDKVNSFDEITVITCPFGNFEQDWYSVYPESLFEIRRRALRNTKLYSNSRNKVYISRMDATHRKMTNELEFVHYLTEQGFDILNFSEISLIEQIKKLSNASVVVSPVGAGSAMAMFAPSDAVIVEISDRSLFGGYNGAVSALLLNQNFHRIVTNDKGQHGNDSLKEDFYGDLEQLKKLLNLYHI